MNTIKHDITKRQYENATFAICTVDASHHLILQDGRSFWLCDELDSLKRTLEDYESGNKDGFTKEIVSVEDSTGLYDDYEALTIPVKNADFGIDIEAFNNGKIDWL